MRAQMIGGPKHGTVQKIDDVPHPEIVFPILEPHPFAVSEDPLQPTFQSPRLKKAIYRRMSLVSAGLVRYEFDRIEDPGMWCGYCHGRHEDEVELMECKTSADEMDLEEPFWLPEAVTGYRGFSLTEKNGLWQLRGVKEVWNGADPGPAECNPVGTPLSARDHKSPKVACMCGYYIVKNHEDLGNWEVEAYVEGWGDIVEHERGYRVERVKIIWIRPAGMTNLTRPIARMIAKRYGVGYRDEDF